ncbi:hypothetical protein Poli38472_003675 [Pythium oligandrum]|uniref:PHD-type domain-containing protein n=1 Tax=Pythium oligandrum TaxID=41045 RepID=A0A8K1FJB9_PYTOL|nr:hypothetical protein Poli38472_003675 [Pythium oligandrum]|eukprot:TMW65910.1 hypothetical protein Poli38472_003675 [Pythium oligandrum]
MSTEDVENVAVEAVKGSEKTATKQERAKKDASEASTRKRRASAGKATAVPQKTTLHKWFSSSSPQKSKDTSTKPTDEKKGDGESGSDAPPTPRKSVRSKPRASPLKAKNAKKMVQRRILLSDQCRVCESAKTDDATRCELKCMSCEMTVHKSCYDVKEKDILPEKWSCRRCQYMKDQEEETPEGDDMSERGPIEFPKYESRGKDNDFDGLYGESEFATVFLFLKRFRRLGLKLSVEITINGLARALLEPHDSPLLQELHTRLLQNLGTPMAKNHTWVVSLVKFLKSSEYPSANKLVSILTEGGDESTWLSKYNEISVNDRVAILKMLCEAQFDENDSLVENIGELDGAEALRDDPVGSDSSKRCYYILEDAPSNLEGSAWLCRCKQHDGSNWETVSEDLASLESFLEALSLSTETADLQLWQTLSSGVFKSLQRRAKKHQQFSQRMARMPRLLGNSGLDVSAILQDSDRPTRSMRTRRTVSYRDWSDGDDDVEEEDEEEDEEDDDDESNAEDDDEGNESPSPRKRRRVRAQALPTRTSRRLRNVSPVETTAVSESDAEEKQDDLEHDEEQEEPEEDDDE